MPTPPLVTAAQDRRTRGERTPAAAAVPAAALAGTPAYIQDQLRLWERHTRRRTPPRPFVAAAHVAAPTTRQLGVFSGFVGMPLRRAAVASLLLPLLSSQLRPFEPPLTEQSHVVTSGW